MNANEAEGILMTAAGTENQRERWRAGVLPEAELRDLARDFLMAPLGAFPSRCKIAHKDLRHRHGHPAGELVVQVSEGTTGVTAAQWDTLKEMQRACDAHAAQEGTPPITLKLITVLARCPRCGASRQWPAVRAQMEWAGRTLTRELAL